MALPSNLETALRLIAADIVDGSLSAAADYRLTEYAELLAGNDTDSAPAVLAVMRANVERITDGSYELLLADGKYLARISVEGMQLAYVPAGEDYTSPSAKYVQLDGEGAYFVERNSPEGIAAAERRRADYLRVQAYLSRGEIMLAELTGVVRRQLRRLLVAAEMTEQQIADAHRVAGLFPVEAPLAELLSRVSELDLEQCLAVMAVTGRVDLPGYPA